MRNSAVFKGGGVGLGKFASCPKVVTNIQYLQQTPPNLIVTSENKLSC